MEENFWSIKVTHSGLDDEGNNARNDFTWERERVFDLLTARIFADMCIDNPHATVIEIKRQNQRKYRPVPLATVELQKFCSVFRSPFK